VGDIAGLCNARGNVLGLMPHPEDHILPIQNPLGNPGRLGLALFDAMIRSIS
jgi:phosphoribosylformylglycinamidine synthase